MVVYLACGPLSDGYFQFFQPISTQELNLQWFTILPTEPLHDLKGHIANVIPELLSVLSGADKELLGSLTGKIIKPNHARGCDWRRLIIVAAKQFAESSVNGTVTRFLRTLAEICHILYTGDEGRTPTLVLRLTVCLFEHFTSMQRLMPSPKCSLDRLYGGYLHGLLHAPDVLMVTSLKSCVTEQLERLQVRT